MNKNQFPNTKWHRILATILEEWLTPVGIRVQTEVPICADPPKADILLLTHNTPKLRTEQRRRLPDGLRDSLATNLVLEFKYTESLNEYSVIQVLGYGLFLMNAQKLKASQVEMFLLCSKTPQPNT